MTTKTNQVTSFYAVLSDPANPARGFDYHVNYVEIATYADGTVVTSQEKQCNSDKAEKLGLGLGPMFSILNTTSHAENIRLKAEKEAAAEAVASAQAEKAQALAEKQRTEALAAQAIADKQAGLARESALLKEIEELTDTEVPSVWARIKAVFVP